jgi:hypothetical protein
MQCLELADVIFRKLAEFFRTDLRVGQVVFKEA